MTQSTGCEFKPHDYQLKAIRLLVSQGAAGLFLDPGLGKTVCVLSAFMVLHKKGIASKILIVAPLRVASKTWPDEIEKWAHTSHLTYVLLHGSEKQERLQEDVDIYIINPEGLKWLFTQKERPEFDTLCLDESSKFKDTQTQRFKLLKPLLPKFLRRWILTGTPAPNGIADLFGQIFILDAGAALGRYITHFRLKYFYQRPGDIYTWIPRPSAYLEIVEKIKPLILQLSAEDYLKMPELTFRDIPVSLPKEARKIYQEVEDNFISLLAESKIIAGSAAVAGGKCRQIANGAVYYDAAGNWSEIHDAKLDALEDLLEELGGAPTLVLYEFKHDAARILARLGTLPVLGGTLSEGKLSDMVDRFNAGSIPVLMGHPASMGHGLNLQGSCRHVVWFGIPWNLEHYDQAIARVYRQGQKAETVFVYHLKAVDTLDEKVLRVLGSKDKTQQSLLSELGKE